MKVRTTEQFVRRRILPSLAGFSCEGRLLYRHPVNDLLCGCYFDDSSYDKTGFTVHWLVLPLYVPMSYLHLTFGRRTGCWNYAKEQEGEIGAEVLAVVRAEVLPVFALFQDAKDFYARGNTLISNPRGSVILEARAYSALRAGLMTEGKALLYELESVLTEVGSTADHMTERMKRARQLLAVADDDKSVQALLTGWREQTVAHLGLHV